MKRGEIIRALNCSASAGEKDCTGCYYLVKQEVPEDLRRATKKETFWEECDVDQIAVDAADLLENDESEALAMQRELELLRARLDCATACADRIRRQNQELRDAAALAKKPTGGAAHGTVRRYDLIEEVKHRAPNGPMARIRELAAAVKEGRAVVVLPDGTEVLSDGKKVRRKRKGSGS